MASKKSTRTPARSRRPAAKKARRVQAVPARYGSIVPALTMKDTRAAIAWYVKVLGARQTELMEGPGGGVMHAELRIGDRCLMLGDEAPEMGVRSAETLGGASGALMLYVKDCDAVYQRAVASGAVPGMPPMDMFWGDRYGQFVDPFGHRWGVATHQKDLSRAQMKKAMAGALEKMAQGAPPTA